MSKRKKKPDHRARLQRMLADKPRSVPPRPAGLDTPDLDRLPPHIRANLLEASQFAMQKPDAAQNLLSLTDDEIHLTVLKLGFPQLFGENPTHEQRLEIAAGVRVWHILKLWTSAYDWWPPIREMSDQQILDQIDADVKAGRIIPPTTA